MRSKLLSSVWPLAVVTAMTIAISIPAQDISSKVQPLSLAPTEATAGDGADSQQDEAAELAKKLQNPVANLISVPIQNNWDFGIGTANAMRYTANIQPVIPVSISKDWNLIIRTILPVIYAEAVDNRFFAPASARQSHAGLGDTTQSFFFSPKNPVGGWYGIKKGLRGRFGVYVPPLMEALGLAELTHEAKNNKMRAK